MRPDRQEPGFHFGADRIARFLCYCGDRESQSNTQNNALLFVLIVLLLALPTKLSDTEERGKQRGNIDIRANRYRDIET